MAGNINIEFELNGKNVQAEIRPNLLLVDLLREQFGLTGSKIGCGMGECGACTVMINSEPANSCLILACRVHGQKVKTIEGLGENGKPSDLMKSFTEEGAVQCGFCTPGFIVSAEALLAENPTPTKEEIRTALSGNLCRCTGYLKIEQAVEKTARKRSEK